jgi:hypothetical protein
MGYTLNGTPSSSSSSSSSSDQSHDRLVSASALYVTGFELK